MGGSQNPNVLKVAKLDCLSQKKILAKVQYNVVEKRMHSPAARSYDDWIDIFTFSGLPLELPFDDIEISTKGDYILVLEIITKKESTEHLKQVASVVVKCGDSKFECHKVFLAARSPVFKAMLTIEMKEKISNEIQIDDAEPEVIAELLKFIYTGKPSPSFLDKCSNAMNLFFAADKYQIEALKEICEFSLISSLTIKNCFSLLIFGDRYCENMKKSALKFVGERNKRLEVEENLGEYPSLMEDLKEFIKDNDVDEDEDEDSEDDEPEDCEDDEPECYNCW